MYREIKIEDGLKVGDSSGSTASDLDFREAAKQRYLKSHPSISYKALLVDMIDNLSSAVAAVDSGELDEELTQLAMFSLREDLLVQLLAHRGINGGMIESKLKKFVDCGFF